MSRTPARPLLIRVLFLEDPRREADLVAPALQRIGAEVEVVDSPGHCLSRLTSCPYGALVVDQQLAGFSGREAITTLQDLEITLPPTVLLTRSTDAASLPTGDGIDTVVSLEPVENLEERLAKALETATGPPS